MTKDKKDRVVIVGGGGREHALAWSLRRSPRVGELFCIPGNPGIAKLATCLRGDIDNLVELTKSIGKLKPDLVVVGPEKPLCHGLVDQLEMLDIPAFGPRGAPADIEAHKSYAKETMRRADVPTAHFCVADSMKQAIEFIRQARGPLVVKADGLCAGKGVIVCDTQEEAIAAAETLLRVEVEAKRPHPRVVIEERLFGREVSSMAFTDGERVELLPSAKDHKRLRNGDQGPMTGGMGAISPAPDMSPALLEGIRTKIHKRTISEIVPRYRGLLYAGLMLTKFGPLELPHALEFNARFGDPEAQAVLPRIEEDVYCWLHDCAVGTIPNRELRVSKQSSSCVVLCAGTYPEKSSYGVPIYGVEQAEAMPGVHVFHSGTALDSDERLVTNGGRILSVTALGNDIEAARALAYETVAQIKFEGMTYRTDIGATV